MIRRILLICLMAIAGLQSAETFTIQFKCSQTALHTYWQNHVVAVWIETPGGAFVKTIEDRSDNFRTMLARWRNQAGTNDYDAILGASQTSGTFLETATWDCAQLAQAGLVADGNYVVWFESVDSDSPGPGTVSTTSTGVPSAR